MVASDLRICNWVITENGNYYQVTGFDIYKADENDEHGLKPIPLTEEILINSGFDVVDDNPKQKAHYAGDVLFKILDFEFTNSMIDGFRCYSINNGDTIIKHLHQLQNLYFALTGKEIDIEIR